MRSMKLLLKDWLPPVLIKNVHQLRGEKNRFKGDFKNWNEAASVSSGYHDPSILDKVLYAMLKVKNGEAAWERDSVLFDDVEYSWPVTSALLWAAARSNGNLNVLDFGGALGSSYFQHRKFVSKLKSVTWHVVEQKHFAESGRAYIEDEILKFFDSIEDSLTVQVPNVILISSVAQYLQNIDNLLSKINAVNSSVLIFDKTPFIEASESSICIQHVPNQIYNASYPMWLLSATKLIEALTNWQVIESFTNTEGRIVTDAGKEFEFGGYIFDRKHA